MERRRTRSELEWAEGVAAACDVEGDGGADDIAMGAQGDSGRVVLVGEMREAGPLEVMAGGGSEELGGFGV